MTISILSPALALPTPFILDISKKKYIFTDSNETALITHQLTLSEFYIPTVLFT